MAPEVRDENPGTKIGDSGIHLVQWWPVGSSIRVSPRPAARYYWPDRRRRPYGAPGNVMIKSQCSRASLGLLISARFAMPSTRRPRVLRTARQNKPRSGAIPAARLCRGAAGERARAGGSRPSAGSWLLNLGRRILARDRFAPDSPLEESGFEPLVPLTPKTRPMPRCASI